MLLHIVYPPCHNHLDRNKCSLAPHPPPPPPPKKKVIKHIPGYLHYLQLSHREKIKQSVQMFLPQVTVLYQEKTSLKTLVSLKQENCKEVQYHVTPKYFIQISFWLLRITEKETHLFLMFRKHKRIGLSKYHMKTLQTYFCTLCSMTELKKKKCMSINFFSFY